jgi:hypothetical protein
MNTKTYNGWTNRATWNAALWLTNDESMYHMMRDHFLHDIAICFPTARDAREFCWLIWPDGNTPDGDELTDVNWDEIADMIHEAVDNG